MKHGWNLVKLGEVLKQDKEYVDALEPIEYKKLSVKLYGKGVVLDDSVNGATVRMTKHQFAKAGQIIVSEIWAKKGAIGIVPKEGEGALCTSHFFLFDCIEEKIYPPFFHLFIIGNQFENQLSAKAQGTTGYASTRPKDFFSLELPLPPLSEQQRIAGRLAVLKEKMDAVRRLRGEQEKEVERIAENAFDFIIPKPKFEKRKIGEVATFKTGKTPPTSHPHYFEGNLDWYCPSDINNQKDCYLLRSSKKISQDALDDNKATWYERETILLISIGGTIGKVGILKDPASSNQQITGIKFNESILPEYGCYWLKNSKAEIINRASQATLPIINQKKIAEIEIAIPALAEQRRIVAEIQSFQAKMDTLKAAQAEQAKELESLFPAVLERAFRGEW